MEGSVHPHTVFCKYFALIKLYSRQVWPPLSEALGWSLRLEGLRGTGAAIRALALHAEETLFPVLQGSFPVALGGAELRGRVRGGDCPPQTRGNWGRGPGLALLR